MISFAKASSDPACCWKQCFCQNQNSCNNRQAASPIYACRSTTGHSGIWRIRWELASNYEKLFCTRTGSSSHQQQRSRLFRHTSFCTLESDCQPHTTFVGKSFSWANRGQSLSWLLQRSTHQWKPCRISPHQSPPSRLASTQRHHS